MKILSIPFILFYSVAICQPSDSSSVKLNVLNDSLSVSSDFRIDIDYSMENVSGTNLICYKLKSKIEQSVTTRMELYCNQEKTGAGIVFLIFDQSHKFKAGSTTFYDDFSHPMTQQKLDSIMTASAAKPLESTVILKSKELLTMRHQIDLFPYKLAKGKYYLQLVYYAGRYISDFVTANQIAIDKNKYQARVFLGCVNSNQVIFTVE